MRIGCLLTVSHSDTGEEESAQPLDADPPGDVTCDACWEANPPFSMWTEGMTDACENVTLPKLRLRAVIKGIKLSMIVPTF